MEEYLRSIIVAAATTAGDRIYSSLPLGCAWPAVHYELVNTRDMHTRPEALADTPGQPTAFSQVDAWDEYMVKLTLMAEDRAVINTLRDRLKMYLAGYADDQICIFWDAYRAENFDTALNIEIGAVDLTIWYKGA